MEGEAPLWRFLFVLRALEIGVGFEFGGLRQFERLGGLPAAARGEHPHHALACGAALVEPDADADVTIALALERAVGGNLAQRAALEIGQFEILEHDLDQFVERDVGLVVIDAGTIAGLALTTLAVLADFAHHLAGPWGALAGAGCVLAIDEAVFLDAAQGDLDDAVAVFADDRFLGDDVCYIFADRLANFLAMARAIASRAIGMFGVGAAIFAK